MASEEIQLPPLFKVYLDMGARVCSEPAIDREFGVIDFLIVLDVETLDERTRKRMFGSSSKRNRGHGTGLERAGRSRGLQALGR